MRLIFNVFGRRLMVETAAGGWTAYFMGNEGKLRPADIAIPPQLDAEAISRYPSQQIIV